MALDYDVYYRNVSSIFNDVRLDKETEISMTTSIIRNYLRDKTSRILDVGCGTGRYAHVLMNDGYSVIGIDKSSSQIEQAKKYINAVTCNATSIPFADCSFELCMLIMVIHQMSAQELRLSLSEIKRVLSNGGILIIKTCSPEDLRRRFSNKYFPSAVGINLTRYHKIDDIERMLLEIGFEIACKINTEVKDTIDSERWIYSIEHKHNSTLASLDENEFQVGLDAIRRDYPCKISMEKVHCHSYIIAKCLE